jgi:radical SAM superfamily enzyme YgiQ (UPF0313 family)
MPLHDHSAWYDAVHPQLMGAGLWLRGGEVNTLPRSAYDERPWRVLFARLSTYYDTGYSFTHQLLYQLAARTPGVFPDLAYLPPKQDLAHFEAGGVPWLLGSQTKFGPQAFDLVGISNSIVQELVNLPSLLRRSGLPLGKRERLERPDLPLVLLGGANALYSSSVWSEDPLVDAVFVGEDDGAIVRLLEIARDAKRAGATKRETLAALEAVDGLLQPDAPRRTKKAFIWNLDRATHLEQAPVYHLADAAGSAHLQISEGCPCFCSFCAESWDRKPYRERKAPVLKQRALALKAAMGLDEVELYSFNFNMHSGFYQVLWDLVPHFRRVGLKSQRFDLLANDPQMMEFQHAIEKSSITCGLEGISPRMRAYLHKNLETPDLHKSLDSIFRSKARALKVFLIATGLEEAQDFEAFSDLLGHMAEIRRDLRAGTRLLFSMTPLVRFPWTPLEYEDAPPPERYADVIERVAKRVRNHGFEFRESAELDEYVVSQLLVRADDPRVQHALVDAVDATGFVYYRETTQRFREALEAALRARGLDPVRMMRGHDFEAGERKPWTLVDTSVKRDFLWQEVLRARSYVEIDYCLGRAWTRAKCFKCGGCPSKEHVRDIVLAKQPRDYELPAFQARVREARSSEVPVALAVEVEAPARGLPRRLFGVALGRALMQVEPRLVEPWAGFAASREGGDGNQPCWAAGADVLTVRIQRRGLAALDELLADPLRLAAVERELAGFGRLVGRAPADDGERTWTIDSPYPFAPRSYLDGAALPHVLRRVAEGHYAYEWSAKAKKRDVLRALEVRATTADPRGPCRVTLVAGRRFELEPFLTSAFALPHRTDWVRLVARAHERQPVAAG